MRENLKRPPKYQRSLHSLLWDNKPRQNLLLAFLVPCGIFLFLLAAKGLILFSSDRMILAHDEWHQYYPFLLDFRRKLLDGSSMLYSWSSGMGTNYIPMYAYYLASPMYLFSVLIPEAYMPDFLALLTVLKVGLAGLFFAFFLKTIAHKCDTSCVAFATLFALCAFVSGYYWNVIWLDTVALLPLAAAGTVKLLRDGKFSLYIVSLFFAVWCNYYISFFVCIFVALFALCYMICCWRGVKNFLCRFAGIAGCTVVALGMTAVLVIPTYLSIANTYSAVNKFPENFSINIAGSDKQNWWGVLYAMRQTLTGLLTDMKPTSMTGNPNVFCGMVSAFLAFLFLFDGKIKVRERICCALLLLFFCASFIFRQLDYIWHGFHFPNMLPHRFSFLFSFVMVFMAWRAFQHLAHYRLWQVLAAAGMATAVLLSSYEFVGKLPLLISFGICNIVVLMYLMCKKQFFRTMTAAVLLTVCAIEAAIGLNLGINNNGLTTKSIYPEKKTEVASLLSSIEEEKATDLFRTEFSDYQTLNDPALVGCNGVTIFSSTTNVAVSDFTKNLGLASWPNSNRYAYFEGTPFTNLMINLKYVINRDGGELNPVYNKTVESVGEVKLQKNTAYLPMGFLMNSEIADYETTPSKLPLHAQQELFSLATGIDEPLYTTVPPAEYLAPEGCSLSSTSTSEDRESFSFSTKNAEKSSEFSFTYNFDEDILFCLYLKGTSTKSLEVRRDGKKILSSAPKVGCMYCLGQYKAGQSVELRIKAESGKSGTITLQAAALNQQVFEKGFRYLAENTMKAEKITDTGITGTIQTNRDGMFYTSIPYENGWRAYVDGKEVEITPVGGAFVAFAMEKGIHRVRVEFTPPGYQMGLRISLICLFVFVLMLAISFWRKRHIKRNPWEKPKMRSDHQLWDPAEQPDMELTDEEE